MMKRLFLIVSVLCLFSVYQVQALSFLQFDAGLLFIGNSEPESAPSPILPTLGMNFPIIRNGYLTLDSSFLMFATYYQYENDRATPVEFDNRDFWVFGTHADIRFGIALNITDTFSMGLNAGLALLLRLPIPLFEDVSDDYGPLAAYFYGKARFIYPETEIYTRFSATKNIDLKLSVRAYYPLFSVWDGEDLPFYDQFMLAALVGFIYKLP